MKKLIFLFLLFPFIAFSQILAKVIGISDGDLLRYYWKEIFKKSFGWQKWIVPKADRHSERMLNSLPRNRFLKNKYLL